MRKLIPLLFLLPFLASAQNSARMLSGINLQSGSSYSIMAADATRLVVFSSGSSVAASLSSGLTPGFGAGSLFSTQNIGAGAVTITCSGCLIYSADSTGSATLTLNAGQGADLYGSAGANYYAVTCSGACGGSGTVNSGTINNAAYYPASSNAVSSTDAITFPGGGIAAVKNGMTIGGGSSACGSATNCQSVATSAGSVTPTSGQNTLRFFGGNALASINGAAEAPLAGGSGGGNPVLENCSSDQTGNTFYNVNSLTNYFYGAWAFVFNTATYITCTVFIPSAQAGATLVLDIAANDSTAGHTANFQTCDQVINSGTINIGAPTCAANQTFTTTATAYNRVTLTFNVQSTLANNSILVVKIATSTTGTPPTANMLVYPHFIL